MPVDLLLKYEEDKDLNKPGVANFYNKPSNIYLWKSVVYEQLAHSCDQSERIPIKTIDCYCDQSYNKLGGNKKDSRCLKQKLQHATKMLTHRMICNVQEQFPNFTFSYKKSKEIAIRATLFTQRCVDDAQICNQTGKHQYL